MKHFKLILVALVAVSSLGASAFDWKQLGSALSSGSLGSVINNVISSDSITVADVTGEWTYSGPAVSFQSDDLLKKAGGAAVATTIENKLAPYYQRAGIDSMKLTFDGKGNVTMLLKNGRTVIERAAGIEEDVQHPVADAAQKNIRRLRIKLDSRAKNRQRILAVFDVHDILELVDEYILDRVSQVSPY